MTAVLRIIAWAWVVLSTLMLICLFWAAEAETWLAITTVSTLALSPGLVGIAVAHFLDWKRLHS